MRGLKRIGIWTGTLAAVLLSTAAWAQGLADRVPNDALVYVEWAGARQLTPAYDQSHLKAVVDQTSWEKFLDDGVPRLIGRIPNLGPDEKQTLRELYGTLGLMAQHPTALYVGPIQPPPQGQPGHPPQVRITLISDAGAADSAAIAQNVTKMLDTMKAEGGEIPFPFFIRVENNVVVLDVGTAASATTQPAPAKPLSADQAFVTAMGQVQKDAAFRTYINMPGIIENVDMAAAAGPPEAQAQVGQVIDALQLDGLGPIAVSAGFDGKDWQQQVFVGKGNKGLPPILQDVLGGQPLSKDALAHVPSSAVFAAAGRLDFAHLYDDVLKAVKQLPNVQPERIERNLDNVNKMLGFNLRDDFLAALGDEYGIYGSPTVGGGSALGYVMTNTPRDAGKLESSVQRIEGMATGMLSMTHRPGQPNFAPQVARFVGKAGDVNVHYVALMLVAPGWAIANGELYFGFTPQAVAAAAQTQGSSITAAEAYQQVMKRLGVSNPSSVMFMDLPKTAPGSYAMLPQILTMINTFGRDMVPETLVPPLPALLPELAPAGGAAWMDDAGWHYKLITPWPGSQLLAGGGGGLTMAGPATIGMMTAILLPSLGKARELANRAADSANLTGIVKCCVIYALDSHDDFPEDLATLVIRGQVPPKGVVSKSSSQHHAPPPIMGAGDAEMRQWVQNNTDYVYAGKGMVDDTDSTKVVVYTRLSVHRDGAEVGFGDAHVEWVPRMQFEQLLQKQNEWRKDKGLALLRPEGLEEENQ